MHDFAKLKNLRNINMTAIEFLQKCIPNGKQLLFPDIQLPREVYNEVKKLLEGVDGRWDKHINGFTFRGDVDKYISKILDGEKINLQQKFQFFETPSTITKKMVELAGISEYFNGSILEPSAGRGAIISAVHSINPNLQVDAIELMDENHEYLNTIKNVNLIGRDFLEMPIEKKYDVIIANPPFSKNQDIKHIEKMWSLLKDGGTLVTIVSTHYMIAKGKVENKFREWVENNAVHQEILPENTFNNTIVKTVLLKFNKPQNHLPKNNISIYNGYIEMTVKSEIWGTTTACGTVEFALQTGYLSCGDGTDYKLTKKNLTYIKNYEKF